MSDPVRLFGALRQMEVRRVALSAAAVAYLVASAVSLGATLIAAIAWPPVRVSLLAPMLAVPWVAALASYAASRRRGPDMHRLLLRLDLDLGLDARLSSLFELRARKEASSHFAERLFREVEKRTPTWKRGFRLSRHTVALFAAGGILFCGHIALAPFALAPRDAGGPTASSAPAALESASTATAPAPASSEPASSPAPVAPTTEDTGKRAESENGASPSDQPEVALADLLSELRRRSGAETVVGSSSSDALAAAPTAGAVNEAVDRAAQELAAATGPLTADEVSSLRAAVAAGPEDLSEKIDELLRSGEPSTLREEVLSLLNQPRTPGDRPSRATGPRVSDVVQQEPQGGTAASDVSQSSVASSTDSPQAPSGSTSDSAGTLSGESSAPPVAATDATPYDSQFVVVAPPAVVGSTGPVAEYLTRGVPVEGAGSETSAAAVPAIDFARVDSILSTRAVPTESLQTIRSYFERITRGGP